MIGGSPGITVGRVCARLDMTRQNYYKRRRRREIRQLQGEIVCGHVLEIRRDHPRMGVRKLRHLLRGKLLAHGMGVGRDRLFGVLRDNGMLVAPYKSKFPKTTRHDPSLPCFANEIKGLAVVRPGQVLVADITYLMTAEGFCYLSLVMDLFSRKVVGFNVSETLAASGCVSSLKDALKSCPAKEGLIHHSDRGCQYASHEYVRVLRKAGCLISMTQENHCYENGAAERLNGILKQEYGLDATFADKGEASRRVARAVELYNNERPHSNLRMRTPAEVHQAA